MKLDESIINQFNLNPNESREPVNTTKTILSEISDKKIHSGN